MSKHDKSKIDNPQGLMVVVRGTDERAYTRALKRFKNMVKDSDLLKDIEKNRFYEKPSLKRKRRKAVAIKRHRKEVEKQLEEFGF